MHVDLRVVNVLSWRDLWAFKLLVWEVTETAWVAPASMMLPSGTELPKSLTDHQNHESCWVQPVAFWMVGGCTPFPSHSTGMASTYVAPRVQEWWCEDRQLPVRKVANRLITGVPHEENTGWRNRLPWLCTTQPRRCRTSGTLYETCVEAGTRLHSGALPPSHIDVLACLLPGPHPLQLMGAQLCLHLCLDASVKRVISVCKALGETPCSTAGEAHPATWENGRSHWNPVWPGPCLLTPGLWCPSLDWAEAKLTSWH